MRCTLWQEGQPCGKCVATMKRQAGFKGHRGYRCPVGYDYGDRGMAITRPRGDAGAARGAGEPVTDDGAVMFPTVFEWLQAESYGDGSARRTSTLLMFCEDGMVKLCLSDRDLDRTGWATGRTACEALGAMEAMLREDRMDWRKGRPAGAKKR